MPGQERVVQRNKGKHGFRTWAMPGRRGGKPKKPMTGLGITFVSIAADTRTIMKAENYPMQHFALDK
jgi:hypothetical protein